MRKGVLFYIILIMLTASTGCENMIEGRNEINELEFVRAIGIDKSLSKEGHVRLTLSAERVHEGSAGETEEKSSTTVFSEGRTVFEAIRNFSKHLDKKLFLGHLEYVIFGEEAARDGINKYLDFFSREHEVRLNLRVYVLKGDRAEKLMEMAGSRQKFVFGRLGGLAKGIGQHSVIYEVNLIEVMYILDIKYLSLYLPSIEMIKASKSKDEEDAPMDIKVAGFAIFDGDRLAGNINDEMGRGLNWLRSKIKSGVVVVQSPKGSNISLEIINARTKIQPQIKNGVLSATVKVDLDSNIGEIQSTEDIFDSDALDYLGEQQEQVVKNEINKVIKYAQQEIGMDFFSMGNIFYHKYPIEWEDLYKMNWRKEFPKVRFNVVVNSIIRRTYDIKQPNAVEEGGG